MNATPGTNVKKELLLAVLERSWAWLHLDGRVAGVELPDSLRGEPSVTLQIGYDMPVPIPDLAVDDTGVRATLSFARTPHTCRIPWKAIFAIADFDGRGALFAEDMPAEMAQTLGAARPEAAATKATEPAPPDEPTPPPAPEPPRLKSGKPRPSHLKLVN